MIPMGFTIMAFMITGNTMLQLTSVPQARGRVMALYGIVFLGSTPIGAPIAGVVGEHLGAQTGLWLSGLVAAGLGVALLGLGAVTLASRVSVKTRKPSTQALPRRSHRGNRERPSGYREEMRSKAARESVNRVPGRLRPP